ncbi:MAG: glycosyltransferase family 2 protein [Chloroflexi bacterium]|nr:glycosyltransferase family 2 protein [Chloroflexota bacterium]
MTRLPGLSLLLPAYNEEANIADAVGAAVALLPRFTDDLEVTVVDDGSADRTGAIVDAIAASDPRVHVVHHRPNRGYGGALRSGFAASTKPYLLLTDSDLQFDLADLDRLLSRLDRAEVVIGYREKRADPAKRRFIAWVYNRIINVLFLAPFRDVDCAFKLFRRDVFERVPLSRVRSDGAFFSPELLLVLRSAGVRIAQVPVRHFPRRAGEEKGATLRVVVRAMRDLLRLRLRLWLRRPALDDEQQP